MFETIYASKYVTGIPIKNSLTVSFAYFDVRKFLYSTSGALNTIMAACVFADFHPWAETEGKISPFFTFRFFVFCEYLDTYMYRCHFIPMLTSIQVYVNSVNAQLSTKVSILGCFLRADLFCNCEEAARSKQYSRLEDFKTKINIQNF